MTTEAPTSLSRATALFQALSDENRLHILSRLRAGEHCVCELTEALDIGQSLLSFHLRTLKDAGLVTDRREGRWVYYALAPSAIAEARTVLEELLETESRPRDADPGC